MGCLPVPSPWRAPRSSRASAATGDGARRPLVVALRGSSRKQVEARRGSHASAVSGGGRAVRGEARAAQDLWAAAEIPSTRCMPAAPSSNVRGCGGGPPAHAIGPRRLQEQMLEERALLASQPPPPPPPPLPRRIVRRSARRPNAHDGQTQPPPPAERRPRPPHRPRSPTVKWLWSW